MSYIYDILVNFNSEFYDFYDWNNADEIIHVKKMPIVRTDSVFLLNVKYNNVVVDKSLLDKIYNKVDFFKKSKFYKENYICALSDGREAFIAKFDANGKIVGRSSLLIDEEGEIVDISNRLDINSYSLSHCNFLRRDSFKTRREIEINNFILDELNNMANDKLKYLYFDCFNIMENDTNIIVTKIKEEIKNNFDTVYNKIYDFLKLSSIKNN